MNNKSVENVVIIPSYNELLALPTQLRFLVPKLDKNTAVVVVDDSPEEVSNQLRDKCDEICREHQTQLIFLSNPKKNGRGRAIRLGMETARENFPNLRYSIECDADGSHRPEDIMRLIQSSVDCDLLVGSRYLPESKIQGWPISRRLFSYLLNKILPRVFALGLTDVTNGLRRYSQSATGAILSEEAICNGFIYLSEQALVVKNNHLTISEIPITFIERISGSSTVTWREIVNSLRGIVELLNNQNR
jgi:dolichol-phosphate mannosyltransferase